MLDLLVSAVIHLSGNYGLGNDTVVVSSAQCPLNTLDTGQTTASGAEVCVQQSAGAVVIGNTYGVDVVQAGWGGYSPVRLGGVWGLRGGRFGGTFHPGGPNHHHGH